MEYTRNAIRTRNSSFGRWDFNVAGRCFSSQDDIALLIKRVDDDFRDSPQAQNSPFDRVKALSLILSYREDAARALDNARARNLAVFAAQLMHREQENCTIKKKFFQAAHLLMGLLRFRRIEPKFLDLSRPEDAELAKTVKQTLQLAEECVVGNRAIEIRNLLKQMTAFIEKRGTNALIFSQLEDLS